MAYTAPQSILARGVVPFALKDGTTGIIAPEARRTYDHIINSRIGDFPSNGLTDTQAKLILSASRLDDDQLEAIWQRTETIDAPGLQDGYWTQLEIYLGLHFVQASERLSLNQMAVQFAGSHPPKTMSEIRRRTSYAQAGLAFRPRPDHDPVPASPSPPVAGVLRRPSSTATMMTESINSRINQANSNQDNASVSQAGLETLEPFHHHAIRSERVARVSSSSTNTTIGAQRLASLIQSRCPIIQIEPDIEISRPRLPESSIVDRSDARDVLVQKRRENPKFNPNGLGFLFKREQAKQKAADPESYVFEAYELSLALREAVERTGNVGVAKVLIDKGADVNCFKQMFKTKLRGFRVDSIPINYTKIAAKQNNVDMVSLFAGSGVALDHLIGALEQAVEQNLPNIVSILLQHGVDPNSRNGSIFKSAITSQNPALIRLLLRSRSRIPKDLLTSNLVTAVEQGQIEIVAMLVTHGADSSFEGASALRKAVRAQRIDLVLTVMKGVNGIARSGIASSVIGDAFSSSSSLPVSEQRLLIDILLCAGANGDPVSQLLAPVARAGHRSIAQLLVMHGANPQYNNAEALRIAVTTDNLNVLSAMLRGKITARVASGLLDDIPHTCSDERMFKILSLLVIDKGARGFSLDKALMRAVQRKSYNVVNLLLDHQASVGIEDSQPLRTAVTEGDMPMLGLLLSKGHPQPTSMQLLLPLIPQSPPQLRLDMTRSIVDAAGQTGIAIPVLNDALLRGLSHPCREVDQYMIPLVDILITAGASVDYQRGKCFRLAAETKAKGLLELLIHSMLDPTSLSPAVPICMKVRHSSQRRKLVGLLLQHGAKGLEVNQGLIDAIEEKPMDKMLVLSLLERADLGYLGGRALCTAVRCSSAELVAAIIDTGKTDQKSRLDAGQILFDATTKERQTKLSLLLRAGVGQEGLDTALIREIGGERNGAIVKLILDYKASCDYDGGKSLELAIRHRDHQILQQLIAGRPNHRILNAMISRATEIKDVTARRTCLGLLLRGGAAGECVGHALVEEVEASDCRDPQIVRLLMDHGARIDYLNGRAIKLAVSSPLSIDLLRNLALGTGASTIINTLVPLAMAHCQRVRLPVLDVLLENGARGEHVDEALVTAVSEGVKAQPTIALLLKYKASVNYNHAEAIKVAALAGSNPILERLLKENPHPMYFDEAMKLAMQSPSSASPGRAPERLQSVRLLTRSKTIRPGAVDSPLIQAVQEEDYELIEHLVLSGADPNFRDGKSVVIAAQQRNSRSLNLLARSATMLSPQTCSSAFSAIPQDDDRWQNESEIIFILVSGGASGPAVDETFLRAVRSSHVLAAKFVSMVMSCKTRLDVNFEGGRSLCIAVRRARFEIVDFLLLQGPNEQTSHAAFMAVFESGVEEQTLIRMIERFFEHSKEAKDIYFQHDEPSRNPLYQTLRRHGDKPGLLQTLFDNGCGAETQFVWTFNSSLGAEHTSALLWLLCQGDDSIDSGTVDILLNRGADPNFRTSRSGTTPLVMAVSSARAEIVLRLLQAGAHPDTQDNANRTPLEHATVAGNIKGIDYLLEYKAEINDESVHLAARKLDLTAVKLLLDHGARTDLPGSIHCSGRTPLGELCRMANLVENPPTLKKTLAFLCEATKNLRSLTHGKSLVLLALDNDSPVKMTTALLTSCQSVKDGLNDDVNIFSKASYCYSPTAYVRHFKCMKPLERRSLSFSQRCCTLDACFAPELESLLRAHGCVDRFWNADGGANQPKGFCNPPAAIDTAIRDAEAEHSKKLRRDRVEAEKKQRREREHAEERARNKQIERDLDAAAAASLRRLEEARAADIRAKEEQAAAEVRAIHQRTKAEKREKRRLAAEETRVTEARRQRERAEFNEQLEQERWRDQQARWRDQQAERTLRERKNIQVDHKKREANIQRELLRQEQDLARERTKLVDSAAGMFREAGYGRVSRVGAGKILDEIPGLIDQ